MLKPASVSCVVARVGHTEPDRLALADIVADHFPSSDAAARAARALAALPGCEMFLVPDEDGGYLVFTRDGRRISMREERPAVAEWCAAMLYMLACSDRAPRDAATPRAWYAPRQPEGSPPQ